jgi:CBS domain-containing protein
MVKPVVTLNECASVHTLLDTLSSSKHNGFPVVKRGENGQASFIGLVLRSQV